MQPAIQRNNSATRKILHELDDVALQAEMGLPRPKSYYCTPTFPFGLQNLTTVVWEVTESKILIDSKKDLNYILQMAQGQASRDPAAPATDQIKTESEEGNPNPTLTIKPIPEGQTRRCSNPHNQTFEELPFQVGPALSPPEEGSTKDPSQGVNMARLMEIEDKDDSMERVNLDDYNSNDYKEYLSDNDMQEN